MLRFWAISQPEALGATGFFVRLRGNSEASVANASLADAAGCERSLANAAGYERSLADAAGCERSLADTAGYDYPR